MTTTTPKGSTTVRKRRNLLLRAGSALATLIVIYFCLTWDLSHSSAWAWTILMAVFSALCLREFYRLASTCGAFPFTLFGCFCGPLYLLALEWDLSRGSVAAGLPMEAADLVLSVAILGSMLLQLTRKTNETALASVGITIFGVLYCAYLPGFILTMRHMAFDAAVWPMHGVEFIIVCIFISKVSDVGALMTGSRWGKTKLIPRLSPGKTWEGAIGGLLFSILLLQLMSWTDPELSLNRLGGGVLILLSVLLAVGGLAGDLIESCFKRNSLMKDAGTGVPGFGGILDLTDSLMVTGPLMYYFLLIFGARIA